MGLHSEWRGQGLEEGLQKEVSQRHAYVHMHTLRHNLRLIYTSS